MNPLIDLQFGANGANVAEILETIHCKDFRWKALKDEGNELYKQGKFIEAIPFYADAFFLCGSWNTIVPILSLLFTKQKSQVAMKKLGNISILLQYIGKYVSYDYIYFLNEDDTAYLKGLGGIDLVKIAKTVRYPNLGAGICAGNIAQCKLAIHTANKNKMNKEDEWKILQSAHSWSEISRVVQPESTKAPKRVKESYDRMVRAKMFATLTIAEQQVLIEHQKRQGEDIQILTEIVKNFSTSYFQPEVIAHLMLDNITHLAFDIYADFTYNTACKAICGESVQVTLSLVPFNGAQMLIVQFHCPGSFNEGKRGKEFQNVFIAMVDMSNGDDLEKPPNGHASKLSLERVKIVLPRLFDELYSVKAKVFRIILGQGLVGQYKMLTNFYKKRPYPRPVIQDSQYTYAAELADMAAAETA